VPLFSEKGFFFEKRLFFLKGLLRGGICRKVEKMPFILEGKSEALWALECPF